MTAPITETSWHAGLVKTLNELGGIADYKNIYPVLKRIWLARCGKLTPSSDATIRRTVEDNSSDSVNFCGRKVFYSGKGIGKETWGLRPDFLQEIQPGGDKTEHPFVCQQGLKGIAFESIYLRKYRDPRH